MTENMCPTSLLTNRLQRWHMQTQREVVFKSFNHAAARCPDVALHSASLKACFINVVQSELQRYSGVGGGVVDGGRVDALFSWFKVGWSRNNGHEKNMATLWEAALFHYFRRRRAPKWGMFSIEENILHMMALREESSCETVQSFTSELTSISSISWMFHVSSIRIIDFPPDVRQKENTWLLHSGRRTSSSPSSRVTYTS